MTWIDTSGSRSCRQAIEAAKRLHYLHGPDLQILCPGKKISENGVYTALLNDAIQPSPFVAGDRVVVTKNRYVLDESGGIDALESVTNGECGTVDDSVTKRGTSGGPVAIRLSDADRVVLVDRDDFELSYAMTVHKAQGSEYPMAAVFLCRTHGPLRNRTILYTAITRAKRGLYIVSDRETLTTAMATEEPRRSSGLAERL